MSQSVWTRVSPESKGRWEFAGRVAKNEREERRDVVSVWKAEGELEATRRGKTQGRTFFDGKRQKRKRQHTNSSRFVEVV
jgi:hypothetical protein